MYDGQHHASVRQRRLDQPSDAVSPVASTSGDHLLWNVKRRVFRAQSERRHAVHMIGYAIHTAQLFCYLYDALERAHLSGPLTPSRTHPVRFWVLRCSRMWKSSSRAVASSDAVAVGLRGHVGAVDAMLVEVVAEAAALVAVLRSLPARVLPKCHKLRQSC